MLMTRALPIGIDPPEFHPPRGCCCGMISKGITLITWIPLKTAQKMCDLCFFPFRFFSRNFLYPKEFHPTIPHCIWIKVKPEDRPPGYPWFYGFSVERKEFNGIPYLQIGHLIQSNPAWRPTQPESYISGDAFVELERRYVPHPEALFESGKANP